MTELYVVTTVECPKCGREVICDNWSKRFTAVMRKKDIIEGKRMRPHNTFDCGLTEAVFETEAFDVPRGCCFGWDETKEEPE